MPGWHSVVTQPWRGMIVAGAGAVEPVASNFPGWSDEAGASAKMSIEAMSAETGAIMVLLLGFQSPPGAGAGCNSAVRDSLIHIFLPQG